MLNFFHSLTTIQIGALLLTMGLTMSTIAPLVARRYFHWAPSEPLAKGAEESFKVMISLSLLLLAFCMVRSQGDHRSVEDLVSREATVIIKLDRAFAAFGGSNGTRMQGVLMNYADAVVKKEWPLLESGGRSDAVTTALNELNLGTKTLDPESAQQQIARAEILAAFTQLSDLREARLSASRLKLPDYLWHAILTSITCALVLGWLQTPTSKMVPYVGGVSLALSLLMTVLISTAGIFEGENAVTPEPIEKAISMLGKTLVAEGPQTEGPKK
ncbi:bestrophin-like domain [Noviherbaspirillum galbum]|uniref:DUF4239 domain-containing protein n=1 Tax=Noviherbaspirillum galbum TaxID=2709383 RepID=A0A6B3SVE3_9BURK|nr:DUF4239 domain-containing protein [Noviherbaspirillum galbum]NEX64488.1 DUF4239 domain-containing protein [Noviherbaspirillum galbum]